jgi:putative ABC transport system permease protein
MTRIYSDFVYSLRLLRKSPGFTAVAIGSIALGIASCTVIATAVDSYLVKPLPFRDPSQLLLLKQVSREGPAAVTWQDYRDWKEQCHAFSSLGYFRIDTFNLSGEGDAERVRGSRVDSGFFRTLAAQPLHGRFFRADEESAPASRLIILSDAFWHRRYNRDQSVIGRELVVDGEPRTIVGVAPPELRMPMGFHDLFVLSTNAELDRGPRGDHAMGVIARLGTGATLQQANAEINVLAQRAEIERPDTNKGWTAAAYPLHDFIARGPRRALQILSVAVGLVLLICCVNVANLLLARNTARLHEMAVRGALGASGWRLFGQLLTESTTLALAGGACGIILARWGVDALSASIPAVMQPAGGIVMDGRVLLFSVLLCIGAGVLFGALPAFKLLRSRQALTLREGARSSSPGHSRLSSAFVVAEVTLAVLLLSSAALMIASLARMQSAELGYEPKGVLTAEIAFKGERESPPQTRLFAMEKLLARLSQLPGVTAASAVNWPPMTSNDSREYVAAGNGEQRWASFRIATPDYANAIGLRLLAGRFLAESDSPTSERVVVVNRRLAGMAFPGQQALGRQLDVRTEPGQRGVPLLIVGIVGDTRHFNPAAEPPPDLYVPFAQQPSEQMYLVLRTTLDPAELAEPLRAAVREEAPNLPLNLVRPMEQVMADGMTPARVTARTMSIFAALALLLAAIGLYGVISFLVASRTYEFGVRLALGAPRSSLFRLVMARAFVLTGIGALLGFAGGLAVARILRAVLSDTIQPEPAAFAGVALMLSIVAIAASWLPVRRALALDPLRALKTE